MRFLTFVLLTLGLFGLMACVGPGCLVADKAAQLSGTFLSTTLECDSPDAVKASMTKLISYTGICKQSEDHIPQGAIANTVCPTIARYTVDFLVKNGIPAEWHCKATTASGLAIDKLTQACEMLPFEPNPHS